MLSLVQTTGVLGENLEGLDGLLVLAVVGVPVRGLMHQEDEGDRVQDGQSADHVADAPVLEGLGAVGDLDGCAPALDDSVIHAADCLSNQTSQNPASDHEGHAEGDEHAAVLGRDGLGEAGGDDGDAGADAEACDQAEGCEEAEALREGLGQGEDAIEEASDDEHLLAAQLVGHDAAASAAENHAEEAPRGQGAESGGVDHCGTRAPVDQTEGGCQVGVGGVDDHEVIAVEDVGQAEQDEHQPGVAVDTEGVDDLRYRELFGFAHVNPSLLRFDACTSSDVHECTPLRKALSPPPEHGPWAFLDRAKAVSQTRMHGAFERLGAIS